MDKSLLIKGGVVLTLDKLNRTGMFDITVRNGKIASIDYEGNASAKEFLAANPGGEVIDANGKIVMPGLFNSSLVSFYSLCRMFFINCDYENLGSFVSLNLIDRYLSESVNRGRLSDMLELIYKRSLRNGELFINESSSGMRKAPASEVYSNLNWIRQYFSATSYDHKLIEDPGSLRDSLSAGFRADEDLNSYALSSLKRMLVTRPSRLVIDAFLSQAAADSIRQTFGKPFVSVLADNGMLTTSSVLVNPCNITDGETGIIKEKGASVIICPSDLAHMSGDLSLPRRLFDAGIRVIAGTGLSGTDILSELKLLNSLSSSSASSESIIRSAVSDPAAVFGIGNVTGAIEKTRSADVILLSLRDLRNSGGLPDLDCESVCWHIISYLNTKDITDVILKGVHVVCNAKEDRDRNLNDAAKMAELSSLLYSAGKFRDYKEKKLRKERVGKIEIGAEITEESEVFVDMTETGEYMGEGEFRILGNKIEEFQHPRDSIKEESATDVIEIVSIESGVNLIDDDESIPEKPKLGIKLVGVKHHIAKEQEDSALKKNVKISDDLEDVPLKKTVGEGEDEIIAPKKSNLRFGFRDGD